MKFLAMFRKELHEEKAGLALMAGGMLGIMVALLWKIDEPTFRFGAIVAMTVLLPFYGLLRTYQTISSDWHNETIQWTLSFPVNGWIPLASKLLAVVTSVTVLLLLIVVGAYSQLLGSPAAAHMTDMQSLLGAFLLFGGVSYVSFLPVIFLGYLVARGLPRWHGIVTGVTFLVGMFVFSRMMENASTHLPPLWVRVNNVSMGLDYFETTAQQINGSPLLGALLFGALTFWASVKLWNRRIDV